jgi:osmoprotectant transport system substrate-binding protein
MDRAKIAVGIVFAMALAGCGKSKPVIRVGSKNFTEQVVLGEIIAQHLERRLGVTVERSLNLGGTLLAHQSLVNGQIDLYPEYTGTALTAVLKQPVLTDSVTVLSKVRDEYQRQFKVTWLKPFGIDNGFAMVTRSSSVDTLSAAAQAPGMWQLGVGYEFEQRPDGLQALRNMYGLRVGTIKTMDLGLLYKALEEKQVDMIAANATDGLLSKPAYRILRDDKHAFPPYELCIEVRDEALAKYSGLQGALEELSGKFTNDIMRSLNYQVDVEHVSVAQVAGQFLSALAAGH